MRALPLVLVWFAACSGSPRDGDGAPDTGPRSVDAGPRDTGAAADAGIEPDARPGVDAGPPLDLRGVIAASCGVGEATTWDVHADVDLAACAPDAWLLEADLYPGRCRDDVAPGTVFRASTSSAAEPVASVALLRGTSYISAESGTVTIVEWAPGTSARIAWDLTLADGTTTTGSATLTFCLPTADARHCSCPP